MPITVKALNLEQIAKKLDVDYLTEPVKRSIFREAAEVGRSYLAGIVPRDTGASARTLELSIRDAGYKIEDAGARLAITADPLRYLEFGTRAGTTKTIIRTRGRYAVRTSGGEQRIKKRRFMAKTIGKTRAEVRRRITDLAPKQIEDRWRTT